MENIKSFIEWAATTVELATIILLILALLVGSLRFIYHLTQNVADAYKQFKVHLAKGLILALEFMVAADVMRTVALDQSLNNVLMLGLLVIIRTFLSWSLTLEVEGRWPWQVERPGPATEVGEK